MDDLKDKIAWARRYASGHQMDGSEEDYEAQCALSAVREILDILDDMVNAFQLRRGYAVMQALKETKPLKDK
jgi:hypothetical protein